MRHLVWAMALAALAQTAHAWEQRGIASHYSHSRRMAADGNRFDPAAMTAAHRTLPFGTRVRVTHIGNGRSVVVRITDRGPRTKGRIIDLSRGAASVIGLDKSGIAPVHIVRID